MTNARARLFIASTLTFAVILAGWALTYRTYSDLTHLQTRIEKSIQISSEATLYWSEQKSKSVQSELLLIAESLTPEFRKTGLNRFANQPNKKNFEFVIKSEIEYRKFLKPTESYLKDRLQIYFLISIITALLSLALVFYFVSSRVFRPVSDLSEKMQDFIYQKYTYQFTVPEQNEVGRLHATFNAMAQKVLKQIEELKTLDKAKSEFLSIASHELRTPLTSIKGSLSLLKSGVVGSFNEAAQNLMNIALNETDRLIRIINEFLDLAKIEAKQFPLQKNWVRAQDLIEKTAQALNGFASQAEVKIITHVDTDIELNVDADRIQQVITNLASNAIKFSPKGGKVTLSAAIQDDQSICISVQDQGRGIAPEDQELIFEKFRQATSANNPLVKGTGLGLAIAKALVEEHQGRIGVQSKPGQGSTFYFLITSWRLTQNNKTAEAS